MTYALATLRLTHPDYLLQTAERYADAIDILAGEPLPRDFDNGSAGEGWTCDENDDSTFYRVFSFDTVAARAEALDRVGRYEHWHFGVEEFDTDEIPWCDDE